MNQQLIDNNYLYIPNFISPDRARELASKFTNFCISNELKGDSQAENSHTAYNYIDFLELLCEKTPEVSKFLGESVLPTYTYARVYKEGSDLKHHVDRDACEISLTLHLAGDTDWPIYIAKPNGGAAKLSLKSGDAMLYLGCDADHWREQFEGSRYVQVFLHYVKSRGERSWAFFDNRDKESPKLIKDNIPKVELKPEVKAEPLRFGKNIEDYIVVMEDVIPLELCDKILKEYADSNDWQTSTIATGDTNTNVRNTDIIGISANTVIEKNSEVRKELDSNVFTYANKVINAYNQKFPTAMIQQDNGYDLLRYKTGGFYVQHTDSFMQQPRAVSCSIALNDDYEGGEWAFWNREKIVRVKKGSVIMFPSNFMYPHEILPVSKGTRYSIITWFI